MKIDPYIRTKGERAGEPGASLESTLVHIGLIKIDGTQVYPTSQAKAEAPQAEDATAPEAEVAAETAADQPAEPAEREPEGEAEEHEPELAASFCSGMAPPGALPFSYFPRRTLMSPTYAPQRTVLPSVVPAQLHCPPPR